MEKTVVELFAGVGGFRVGLNNVKKIDGKTQLAIENNDWQFVWANQWEPSTKTQSAFDCYITRFGPSENHVNEDISTIDNSSIPNHSLLVGGFPCQDYSVARGLSGEKGIQGKKGVLWWQIYEILEKKRTPFVLLENVDRLLKSPSKQRGRDFGIMLRGFHDLGYGVEWRVINAADYGMPQRRRRVFIFAFHKSTAYYEKVSKQTFEENIFTEAIFAKTFKVEPSFISHLKDSLGDLIGLKDIVDVSDKFSSQFRNSGIMLQGKYLSKETKPIVINPISLKSILEKNVSKDFQLTSDQVKKFEYLKGSKKVERVRPNGEPYFYSEGSMAFPENLDSPGRTMLTSESSINRSSHIIQENLETPFRTLTPIEAERLNMFPDDWTNTGMTHKRRYFMMGNALVTGIVSKLEGELSNLFENEK
jgi:DNA (cytosine-5)-methyltransferase 1